MCLRLEDDAHYFSIASEDIICYKVILEKDSDYFTPYHCSEIAIGGLYNSKIDVRFDFNIYTVEQALHSFCNLVDAQRLHSGFNTSEFTYRIVKCCIPQGSTYYKGWFQILASYASDKLRYDEIIY